MFLQRVFSRSKYNSNSHCYILGAKTLFNMQGWREYCRQGVIIVSSHNENAFESVAAGHADSEQYRPALHRFLVSRLRNAEDARDLAQETYLRFYQRTCAGAIRRPGGYLFRIAANLIYEFRLRNHRDCVTYDSEMVDTLSERTVDPSGTDPIDQLALTQELMNIVASIPPTYRKVLVMHMRDGHSCLDIANALGLTQPSVRVYLARAIAYARNARWKQGS